jgi:hypothetical protein
MRRNPPPRKYLQIVVDITRNARIIRFMQCVLCCYRASGHQGLEPKMLVLPSASSALRNLFDVAHLAEIAAPANRAKLRTFREAVTSARQYLAAERGAKAVNTICLCADGTLQLVSVGPKGGIKRLWNFGAL